MEYSTPHLQLDSGGAQATTSELQQALLKQKEFELLSIVQDQDMHQRHPSLNGGEDEPLLSPSTRSVASQLDLLINGLQLVKDSLNVTIEAETNNAKNSSYDRMNDAATALQNNSRSFGDFLVNYLNGRHQHLSGHLRNEIKSILSPFFADASDIRQVTSRIVKTVRMSLKVEHQDVENLSQDLQKPLGALLGAIITILENIESEVVGSLKPADSCEILQHTP